jgi:hypothetical protein
MVNEAALVHGSGELFGARLRGLFLFGSRIAGRARDDSDLDVAVWLNGPLRRRTTWVPWFEQFGEVEPRLDPTFFTDASLDHPPGWMLEAVHGGTRVLYDPSGRLHARLAALHAAIRAGVHRRRLFMGLPYYEGPRP